MKKKILLSILLSSWLCLSNTAFAVCNNFDSIEVDGPSGVKIISLSVSGGNLHANKINDTSFNVGTPLQDNVCQGNSGTVSVRVGDGNNYCDILIQDGPFMTDPVVQSFKCNNRNLMFGGLVEDYYYHYKLQMY